MPAKNSPTAKVWNYPTRSYRPRFQTINRLVIDFDLKFKKLPPAKRHSWEEFAEAQQWMNLCDLWEWLFDMFTSSGITGVQAYEAVNLAAYTNATTFTDDPPLTVTAPSGDTIQAVGSVPYTVKWDNRVIAPTSTYIAWVAACPLMHEPESGPASSKFKFQFAAPILYQSNFSLAPVFNVSPGYAFLPWTAFAVVICDTAAVPFAGARIGFAN